MTNRMSIQNKEKILQSFFQLLNTSSFENITVVELTNTAGISRKTFYRCFKSKDQLLNNYLEEIMYKWIKHVNNNYPSSNDELIDLLFEFWLKHSYELKILINANLASKILDKFNEIFPKYFIELHNNTKNSNLTKKDRQSLQYLAYLRLGGIWNIFANWLTQPNKIDFNILLCLVKKEYNL
ncbi:TetR/AcrR family transcriptional regulator [Limosilactobacillus reuteri]|uniref:TetR/AcrR family transcriptional regulator n=1 Tax=Limosilactobacillus reuteri TaxID=1598 RepID=UPI001E59789A|nr:TetR/AcrR family transcriptional regulator [Limosilactobacillus reuteri]MCC4411286.1 TetR/AcrR family transcriptional regulator [Limosilactobacillus reuteri]